MELTYIPEGCVKGKEVISSLQNQLYYYEDKGLWKFSVTQNIIDGAYSFINDKSGQIACVEIGKVKALLVEYHDKDGLYSLTWQDDKYRYTICGYFSNMGEIVRIAEGLKVT